MKKAFCKDCQRIFNKYELNNELCPQCQGINAKEGNKFFSRIDAYKRGIRTKFTK